MKIPEQTQRKDPAEFLHSELLPQGLVRHSSMSIQEARHFNIFRARGKPLGPDPGGRPRGRTQGADPEGRFRKQTQGEELTSFSPLHRIARAFTRDGELVLMCLCSEVLCCCIPSQIPPSLSKYPVLQAHSKLPIVLLQSWSQGLDAHSFTSVQ